MTTTPLMRLVMRLATDKRPSVAPSTDRRRNRAGGTAAARVAVGVLIAAATGVLACNASAQTPQAPPAAVAPAIPILPPSAGGAAIEPDLTIRGGVNDTPAVKSAPRAVPAAPPTGANTTVVPRSAPGDAATPAKSAAVAQTTSLTCTALLTDDGPQIEQGLVWRVFEDDGGKTKPIATSRDAAAHFALKPGAYVVNVAFGRANLTRKVVVKAGAGGSEAFVLNAGGLRVEAVLDRNRKAPANAVAYDIFSDERDQSGNRARIMTGARPGLVVRLNAGIYHIVSTYGDANASVPADITVEAGKLTQVRVLHSAARVTFKLVARAGGDALAGTQWLLMTPQGEHVKESVGALPSHIIAPGTYIIVAKQGGKAFRRSFAVQAGDVAQVEVVMQ